MQHGRGKKITSPQEEGYVVGFLYLVVFVLFPMAAGGFKHHTFLPTQAASTIPRTELRSPQPLHPADTLMSSLHTLPCLLGLAGVSTN